MPLTITSGVPKISKQFQKNNAGHGRGRPPRELVSSGLGLATVMTALFFAPRLYAAAVVIGWQAPMARSAQYELEIAKDAGFAEIVFKEKVQGTGYVWEASEEGVYHWRLVRPATAPGVERNTFISGSFAALDAAPERPSPARLSWGPEPGADRYKL